MRRVSALLGSAVGVGVIGGLAWYIARDSAGAPETTAIPIGAMVVLACVGLALVWRKDGIKNARRDIGTALLTGLIVGAAIVWLQFAVQHSIDRSAERQNLRLTQVFNPSFHSGDLVFYIPYLPHDPEGVATRNDVLGMAYVVEGELVVMCPKERWKKESAEDF
jgi:xanthine/uracil permease